MGEYFAERPFDTKHINIIAVTMMATNSSFNLMALCIFYHVRPSKTINVAKVVFNILVLTCCMSRLAGLMNDSQTECSVAYPQSISIGLLSELVILFLIRKLLEFKGKHDGIFFDSFGMIVVFKAFIYFLYAVIQLYVTEVIDGCKFRSGQEVLLGINMLDLLTDIYVVFHFVRYITDLRRRQEKQEIRSSNIPPP